MNFHLDKKLKYDPKHVISQRKTTSRLGTYEHKEDEVLALMANESYIEHDIDITGDEREVDKGSEEQIMVDLVTRLITPFKGERTLKRPATDITNMEIDTASKKPRVSAQGKEVVGLDDDDDEHSINQIKGIQIIEDLSQSREASHQASPSATHSTSHSERTISHMVTTRQSS